MASDNHIFIDNIHLLQNDKEQVISYITLGKNYIDYTITNKDRSHILFAKATHKADGSIGQPEFDSLLADGVLRNSSEVHLAIDTIKQTLIPTKLLSNQNREVYFNSIHDIEKDEDILDQQVNQEITELYVVKKSTISYLKNEFKQVKIYSHSACLLSTYTKRLTGPKTAATIFIHTSHDTFYFTFMKRGELQYYQSFDLISASDILYCLLNVLQWQQVNMRDVKLYLTGFSQHQNDIASLLANYFSTATFDQNSFDTKIADMENFPVHILFNQYSLMSCVS